ncbi:MAG: ABC transporter permease [Chloroflexi bacterium]|nr:ABC transporter permease [Chloroflexota bacterium]MBV9595941.1 ABC transporter permease [Chloroflexota bacterium]
MIVGRVLRRTLASIGILLGVSVLVFAAVRLVPGDPISLMLGKADTANAQLVAEFRRSYGLDDPLPVQYLAWLSHIARGDFGRSLQTQEPVASILARRVSATLILASVAAVVAVVVGVLWGVAAAYSGGLLGRGLRSLPMLLMSVPAYTLGIALTFIFAVSLRVLPSSGMQSPVDGGGPVDLLRHLILPATTLAIFPAALTARITSGTLDELRHEEYVRGAFAAGLSARRIALRHVLPNALLPIITNIGVLIGGMFTAAVFVETIFGWPGVGTMMVSAVGGRDYPTLQAGAFVVAGVFVVINWLVDIAYGAIDPRIRTGEAAPG